MVREIFQRKKSKDFYRDQLEYFEYNPNDFVDNYDYYYDVQEDEEIAYKITKKIKKIETD